MASEPEVEFYRRARVVAERQVRDLGMAGDAACECVQRFVTRWLFKSFDPPIWTWPQARRDAFLARAARNHALNFLRDSRRECVTRAGQHDLLHAAGEFESGAGVAAPLFRQLFWKQVGSALDRLTVRQRTLLVRFDFEQASIAEIAAELDCTCAAVKEGPSSARKRLRHYLVAQGDTEIELRSYLCLCQPEKHYIRDVPSMTREDEDNYFEK